MTDDDDDDDDDDEVEDYGEEGDDGNVIGNSHLNVVESEVEGELKLKEDWLLHGEHPC